MVVESERFRKDLGGGIETIVKRIGKSANPPCGTCNACCRFFEIGPVLGDDLKLFTAINSSGEPMLPKNADNVCCYLVENKCSIYDRRPSSCRQFDCRVSAIVNLRYEKSGDSTIGANQLNVAVNQWDLLSGIKTHQDVICAAKTLTAFTVANIEMKMNGRSIPGAADVAKAKEVSSRVKGVSSVNFAAWIKLNKPIWLESEHVEDYI